MRGATGGESSTGVSFVSFGGCGSIADHRLPRSRQSGRPGALASVRGDVFRGGWARSMALSSIKDFCVFVLVREASPVPEGRQ